MSVPVRQTIPCVLAVALLSACTPLPSSIPSDGQGPSPAPFFAVEGSDAKAFQTLAREQDSRLTRCSHDRTCEQQHFTRALLALYEDQEAAAKHFQEVITAAPKSRLATVSEAWLKVLEQRPRDEERESRFAKATRSLILELLQQEQELLHREQMMRVELGAREKKLEELATQIELLKRIDQEMNEKSARTRPRTKVPPHPGN
ncbi:hypothetical protein [Candidatus Nitrospira bockiana]